MNLFVQMFLAVIWGSFAYVHFKTFMKTHEPALLVICIAEAFAVAFFISRSSPKSISMVPFDWVVAVAGTVAPLFLRPASWGVLPVASNLIIIGALIQLMGLISLNRSFAIVAAKREIKTKGMYRYVRHPLYASYVLTFGAYLLTHSTLWNLLVYTVVVACIAIRISREENHLAQDPLYREYMEQVRYRVVPFVY
ncbi:methyltransferase family protein [Noviherbaspirillum saxi]|nr:isoprenylcysteine carboxylmethyltransferase family protein [Noviherbaspirillum saxi]